MEPALQAHGASITDSRPNNGSSYARLWDQKLTFEVTATGPCGHRSPGHHVDGGSLAEILRVRKATKWLLLYA